MISIVGDTSWITKLIYNKSYSKLDLRVVIIYSCRNLINSSMILWAVNIYV